ncbi:MAG: hypothetical protein JJT95_05730 [Pararhodobacter sp.]|nr:hypothetical protein [Pararhodobacter sp.]
MDSETLGVIVFVILFLGFFAYMLRDQIIQSKADRQALDRLASQRGWRIKRQGARPGRGRKSAARIIITPVAGESTDDNDDQEEEADGGDWRLEVLQPYRERGGHGGQNPGETLFHAPAPRFDGAMAVIAAPTPAGASLLDPARMIAGTETRRLLADLETILGADAKERIKALTPCPAPDESALTVLASADPSASFDLREIGRILGGWDAKYWLTPPPRLVLGDEGMLLFVKSGLESPEGMSAFLRMANAVRHAAAES